MLLTISTTHTPATDLSWLLHKQPDKCQEFTLGFGKAYVFYSDASLDHCSAGLLLDVDPVSMVRGRPGAHGGGPLDQYVNDRPYVASSFMSVAISNVLGSALQGKCKNRPELVNKEMPLIATLSVLPCRGGEVFLRSLFDPLGYEVGATKCVLDPVFTDWGDSPYFNVTLAKKTTVQSLLTHLYVLIPVLDNFKHYYVGESELKNLLSKGEGWLASHPSREIISSRYLKYQKSLARRAIIALQEEDHPTETNDADEVRSEEQELEERISLNDRRIGAVIAALKASGAIHILDLGCGEGRLLRALLKEKQFGRIKGMDVSIRSLEIAADRLRLEEMPDRQRKRIELIHGSLMYRDRRLEGYDAAAVVEVIEHLDPFRLKAFERVLFEFARPRTIVLSTPNREYNSLWPNIGASGKRHRDHRFEWTRKEFEAWSKNVAQRFDYRVRFLGVGEEDQKHGAPTQMAIFTLEAIGDDQ